MAPEIRNSKGQSRVNYNPFRADVYSLGMTLLAMASVSTMKSLAVGFDPLVAVQGLAYSGDLKTVLKWMLTEREKSRPDFEELSSSLRSRLPDPKAAEKLSRLATVQEHIKNTHEATAIIASNLEELWSLALLTKWQLPTSPDLAHPQFYQRKVEVQEGLGNCTADSVDSYPFHYMPITEFVTDYGGNVMKTLIVEKTTGNESEFTLCKEIAAHFGSFRPCDRTQRCMFTVNKDHSTVTISEPAGSVATVLVRLMPNRPVPLLPHAMFRLGSLVLKVTDITRTSLSIEIPDVDTGHWTQYTYHPDTTPIRIGRKAAPKTLAFEGKSLSSTHAQVAWTGTHWTIEDLASTNGTWQHCHTELSLQRESDEVRLVSGQIVSYDSDQYRFWLRA